MYLNDVMKATGLTRKAVEYYQEKELIRPGVGENGYRVFSDEDVKTLRQIKLLRDLDVPVSSISEILKENDKVTLKDEIQRIQIRNSLNERRIILLQELSENGYSDYLQKKADDLNRQEKLADRIQKILPGFMGQIMILNFMQYLNVTAETADQEEAFEKIVSFIDAMPKIEVPAELKNYLDEVSETMSVEKIQKMNSEKQKVIEGDFEQWLKENEEVLNAYSKMKMSEEYINSPAYRFSEFMKQYLTDSGFYRTILPLMRIVSPSYDHYYRCLMEKEEMLKKKYTDISKWPGTWQ